MFKFLDFIPLSYLIVFAVIMFLLPISPMPHVVEKLIMLKNGLLHKPIDIFDLFFHLFPTVLLVLKLISGITKK